MGSKSAYSPDNTKDRAARLRAQAQAFRDIRLAKPPSRQRARELWLQHAAGLILFEKVRAAGLATLEPDATSPTRAAVELAVDATMYALMMQIDGVSGGLKGSGHELSLSLCVELRKGDSIVDKLDLHHGDGMCMGFHYWLEGDFGTDPVVAAGRARSKARATRPVRSGSRRRT
jgi:hypothetical protein